MTGKEKKFVCLFFVVERCISIEGKRSSTKRLPDGRTDGRHVHKQGVDERVDLKKYGRKEPPSLKGNEK
jgi:hypothetical protein